MRFVWLIIWLLPLIGFSQETEDLHLSTKLEMNRLGVWENGKAKIYVPLDSLEKYIRQTGEQYLDQKDSIYVVTGNRYIACADTLKNAKQGFDLKKIQLYYGYENLNSKSVHSTQLIHQIWRWLNRGQAAVYFKNKRVYELKKSWVKGKGIAGKDYLIYYKKEENVIWKHHTEWGW